MTAEHPIVAFLRARLDEDEQVARAAHGPNWSAEKRDVAYGDEWIMSALTQADAAHIARQCPARVLREVEAKRKLIDRLTDGSGRPIYQMRSNTGTTMTGAELLHMLALPYEGHPDYAAMVGSVVT